MKFINFDYICTAEVDDGYIKITFRDGSSGRYQLVNYPNSPSYALNSNSRFLEVKDIEDERF